MPQINALIDAYIDANLLLLFAFLVGVVARALIGRTRLKQEFSLQLGLTEGLIVAAALCPLLALALTKANAWLYPSYTMNLTDIAVAQFLDGRMSMDAVTFESILTARQSFVDHLAQLETWWAIALAGLFAAGFAFAVGKTLQSVLQLKQLIRYSYVWRRFGKLDIRLSDSISVPFSTRGLKRRHIVLPSGMLAEPEALRIALAHELQHMRRRDVEWEMMLTLLQPLFFWNPAFGLWKRSLERLRELACDQALLRRRRVTPRGYADCLLNVCRRSIDASSSFNLVTPRVPLLSTHGVGQRNFRVLQQRISVLSESGAAQIQTTRSFWLSLSMLGLICVLAVSAFQKRGDWSQDRLMLSTVVNLERLKSRNTMSGFVGY